MLNNINIVYLLVVLSTSHLLHDYSVYSVGVNLVSF